VVGVCGEATRTLEDRCAVYVPRPLDPHVGPEPNRPAVRDEVASVRTFSPKPGDIDRAWHVIDASDVVLGRLASQSAQLLRGKHKPTYAPHMDTGDFVIIVNAEKISLSGGKREEFVYHHSGYPGGLKARTVAEELQRFPARLVEKAVKGMLPKNRLGRAMGSKLKVYAGPEHPHAAQKPVPYEIRQVSQ
jgi:large subunit ribosomal protein L13